VAVHAFKHSEPSSVSSELSHDQLLARVHDWPAEPEQGLRAATREAAERLKELHERYFDTVWRYVRRLGLSTAEADDVSQQVFITLAAKLSLVEPGCERSWLYGTGLRLASNMRKRAARRLEVTDHDQEHWDEGPGPDDLLQERRARALLDGILASMKHDLRVVFVLFEIDDCTMVEIAETLAIPIGTVASRLRRARAIFEEHTRRLQAHDRWRNGR
jgi:RNA polymerase sigma-70 factor, ECF subfamily